MPRFFAPPWLTPWLTLLAYWPALLALALATGIGWLCRPRGKPQWGRAGLSVVCLVGWAALEPLSAWRGTSLLLLPAAAVVLIEALLVWRRGRNARWPGFAAAALVGWWLARVAAVPGEFWRIWIVVAALVALVAWVVRQQPMRGLALSLALWGGMAITGFPTGSIAAAAVLTAAWAGPMAVGAAAAVPSALVAALLAATDLARGRLARGHLDAADIVCLLALAAPLIAAALQSRLSKRLAVLAPFLGAALAVALSWGVRRIAL